MKINRLTLTNFRNYNNQCVELKDGLNVIKGKNAQGKTNLLESVFLCAIGRSPRTVRDKDLIKWDSTYAKVDIETSRSLGDSQIELYLFKDQNKAIKINKIGIKKLANCLVHLMQYILVYNFENCATWGCVLRAHSTNG